MRGKTTEVERLTQQYELSSGVYVLLVAQKPKTKCQICQSVVQADRPSNRFDDW